MAETLHFETPEDADWDTSSCASGRCRWTFLYLMRNRRNGYTKIGISDRPLYREKTLQAEEPEIDLFAEFWVQAFVEDYCHHYFADKRVRGEWFNLDLRDIVGFYITVEEGMCFGPQFKQDYAEVPHVH